MDYELLYSDGKVNTIKRVADNAYIPIDAGNRDYQAFLKWNKAQKIPLDLNSTIEVTPPANERFG